MSRASFLMGCGLLSGLTGALLLSTGCDGDGQKKGLIVLPGMHESIPYDAYDKHPTIRQTLRLPPDGTVPLGAKRIHYGTTEQEAKRAGLELRNPVESNKQNLARGKTLFETFCVVCHGASGNGDGPMLGRFAIPSVNTPRAKTFADGQLFHVISYGQGIMASYDVQVLQQDRWRIVHYLRTLQRGEPAKPPTKPAPAAADAGVKDKP